MELHDVPINQSVSTEDNRGLTSDIQTPLELLTSGPLQLLESLSSVCAFFSAIYVA
jgi:hypothetical protein